MIVPISFHINLTDTQIQVYHPEIKCITEIFFSDLQKKGESNTF